MKKILIVLLIGLFFNCDRDGDGSVFWDTNKLTPEKVIRDYQVMVIDDCQYILYDTTFGYNSFSVSSHKGNCNNPIHCHNK